jgi:hypothetical protein
MTPGDIGDFLRQTGGALRLTRRARGSWISLRGLSTFPERSSVATDGSDVEPHNAAQDDGEQQDAQHHRHNGVGRHTPSVLPQAIRGRRTADVDREGRR